MSDPLSSKPLPDFTHGKSRKSFFKRYLRFLRYIWVRWALVLAFLAIMGLIVAPKLHRKLKTRRVQEQMSKFDVAMAQGQIEEASKFLRVAQMLRPESPDVQQGLRRLSATQGVPAALDETQRLMALNAATPDDLLILAEKSLHRNMTEIARQALGQLAQSPSTRRTILEIRLKHLDGENAEAVELAQSAAASCGDGEDADKILLEGGVAAMAENAEASREILLPLSKKTTITGLSALRLLAAQALRNPQDAALPPRELAEQIKAHPLRDGNDLLSAANLELASDPSQQKALVESLMLARATAEKPDALALAHWLISHQEYQSAIDYIREKRAVSEDVWFFPYLVALAHLENWEEMNSFLRSWNLPLTAPSLRLLFLAHAAAKNGDEERAKALWAELEIRCLNEPAPFAKLLVETTWKFGHPEEAKRLAWALARNKDTSDEGFRLVLSQLPTSTPARDLIPIYQEMLGFLPDSASARRELAYQQLIAEENISHAAEIALEAHKKSPNKRSTRHIAALALLRLGEIAQADALYDTLPLRKNDPAAHQAIRVAILRKMNRPEEAEALAATINQAQLSPEEQRLLTLGRPFPPLEEPLPALEEPLPALEEPLPPLESWNSAWGETNWG
jgi:hypothetical protein